MRRAKDPRVGGRGERTRTKNRRNKQESVRRFRAWNNVLIVLLHSAGYDVVVQKTTRPRKRDEQSIFPIVRVSKGGRTCYDEGDVSPETTSPERRNMIFNRVVAMLAEARSQTERGCVDVINHGVRNKGTKRETARYSAEIVVHVDGCSFNITDDTIAIVGQSAWDALNTALSGTKRNENVLLVRKGDATAPTRGQGDEVIRKEFDCSIEDLVLRTLQGDTVCVGVVHTSTTHSNPSTEDAPRQPEHSPAMVQGSVRLAADVGGVSVGGCLDDGDPTFVFTNFTFKNESEMDGFIAGRVTVGGS